LGLLAGEIGHEKLIPIGFDVDFHCDGLYGFARAI
jgi:hypothetical protein